MLERHLESAEKRSERALRWLAVGISIAALAGTAAACDETGDHTSVGAVASSGAPTHMAAETPEERARPTSPPTVEVPDPVVFAPATYENGEAAYRDRDYTEARRIFSTLVSDRPNHAWGHYMLGLSEWKAGQLIEAETAFRRVLELDEDHVKSLVNLGRVLLELDRPEEARELALRARDIDPTSGGALRTLARAESGVGNPDSAVAVYEAAIRLNPEDAWSMNNLGLIRVELGRFEEAIGPLARATELRGDVPVFHNNLAAALEGAGYGSSALAEFERTVELDPQYAKAVASVDRLTQVTGLTDRESLDLVVYSAAFVDGLVEHEAEVGEEEGDTGPGSIGL